MEQVIYVPTALISPIKYQAIATTKEEIVESQSRFWHMWRESVEPFFSESQEHTSVLLVVVDNDGLPSAACDGGSAALTDGEVAGNREAEGFGWTV